MYNFDMHNRGKPKYLNAKNRTSKAFDGTNLYSFKFDKEISVKKENSPKIYKKLIFQFSENFLFILICFKRRL